MFSFSFKIIQDYAVASPQLHQSTSLASTK